LYGVMIGTLFSGSFVVEVVTAWPGLGRLMVDALRARDIYLVAGAAAAGAACLAAGTFLADIVHARADERGYTLLDVRPEGIHAEFKTTPNPARVDGVFKTQAQWAIRAGVAGLQKA
jgi:hypothetical protein